MSLNDTFGASATVTVVTQGANGTVTFLANGDVTIHAKYRL